MIQAIVGRLVHIHPASGYCFSFITDKKETRTQLRTSFFFRTAMLFKRGAVGQTRSRLVQRGDGAEEVQDPDE